MSKPWITTNRDRRSKKYQAILADLRASVTKPNPPMSDKQSRKRERSQDFRARGE
jgi:hypothetical protein